MCDLQFSIYQVSIYPLKTIRTNVFSDCYEYCLSTRQGIKQIKKVKKQVQAIKNISIFYLPYTIVVFLLLYNN